ncbi:hypothetical protein AgCh_024011 [Apium graveolens]
MCNSGLQKGLADRSPTEQLDQILITIKNLNDISLEGVSSREFHSLIASALHMPFAAANALMLESGSWTPDLQTLSVGGHKAPAFSSATRRVSKGITTREPSESTRLNKFNI